MGHQSVLFECDHLRPVVQVDGVWRHVHPADGTLTSECGAGAYRIAFEHDTSHRMSNAVFAHEVPTDG
jgi:hypothetical protein